MLKSLLISAIAILGIKASSLTYTTSDTISTILEQSKEHPAQWEDAYHTSLTSLTLDDFLDHTGSLFASADFDQNNVLDTDEYATFMVVKAEMAHLNGFLAIEVNNKAYKLPLHLSTNSQSMDKFERTRIDALARTNFYTSAGNDQALSQTEFLSNARKMFDQADKNLNGILKGKELKTFTKNQSPLMPFSQI